MTARAIRAAPVEPPPGEPPGRGGRGVRFVTQEREEVVAEARSDVPSDEDLIAAVADGDEGAFATLYDRTCTYVFGLLLRILNDRERAEEVAQEVYLQVWHRAASFDRKRGSGLAWLGLLARSRAIDRARSDASYADAVEGLEGRPCDHPVGRAAEDPDEWTAGEERRALLRSALEGLPAEQREALELAFFGGFTHREIARDTGTPLGTVKSRIRAAIDKLETALPARLGPSARGGGS